MAKLRGALIEILESRSHGLTIIPDRVRINGVDVGVIAAGGIKVNTDDSDIVSVELTLFPERVVIGHAAPAELDAPIYRSLLAS
jgi:hypothetical protein